MDNLLKNLQYYKFCFYGFLKNLRFFDAFFILFLVEKGVSFTQIGILYASREIATNLLEIPSGILSDTYGRKSMLAASMLLYISSFSIFYLFSGFLFFFLAFILFGIAESFRSGTHKGIIMDYLYRRGWENHAVNYYGHTRSWSQLGSALSALLAGLLVFFGGNYQSIFLYSTVPYLMNLILILTYPTYLNNPLKKSSQKNAYRMKSSFHSLLINLKNNAVRNVIYSSATYSGFLKAVKDYIQLVMVNLALILPVLNQVDLKKKNGLVIGLLYFIIFIASSMASKFSSKAEGKYKGNIAMITMILGFCAGLLSGIFYHYSLYALSLLAFAGIYMLENIRKPILTGAIAEKVPKEILTSVLSAQSLLRTIIASLLALIFGLIADRSGVGTSLIVVSALLLLFTTYFELSTKKHS